MAEATWTSAHEYQELPLMGRAFCRLIHAHHEARKSGNGVLANRIAKAVDVVEELYPDECKAFLDRALGVDSSSDS